MNTLREASIKRKYLEEQLHNIESQLASLSNTVEEVMWKAYPEVKGKEVYVVPKEDMETLERIKSSVHAISHLLRDRNFYSDYSEKSNTHPRIYAQLAYYHLQRQERVQAKLYIDKMDMNEPWNRAVFSEYNNIQVIPEKERDYISFCDQVYGGICPIIVVDDMCFD